MGMYTEIYVNIQLKENTPKEVIGELASLVAGEKVDGRPSRWDRLFRSCSYSFNKTSCAELKFDRISGQWSFLGKGDIKNYDGEIQMFFKWIKSHVDGIPGDFIGYYLYEEFQEPTMVYLEEK